MSDWHWEDYLFWVGIALFLFGVPLAALWGAS